MSAEKHYRYPSEKILERCDELALISEEKGRITRSFLSPAMERASALVASWMAELDLDTERDHVGNLIGTRRCGLDDAPVLVLGSHLDTVRDAGRYDGALGVLLALAVAEACRDSALPFDLEVVAFSDEEGVRFGLPFLGSLGLIGELDRSMLSRRDRRGLSLGEVIRDWGGEPDAISCRYADRRVLGYLEAHIEQGPVLVDRNLPLGVLANLSGSRWLRLSFEGCAGHAGTTPMRLRRDALAGAAAWILEVEKLARAQPGLVATVGALEVAPGSSNVIPGRVELSLDVRHPSRGVLEKSVGALLASARQIGAGRQLSVTHEILNRQPGVGADERLSRLLTEAVRANGVDPPQMNIGAGHDAGIMARVMPVAMLMIRSPGGVSHRPDEAVLPGDIDLALASLRAFVARLAEAEAKPPAEAAPPFQEFLEVD